MSYLDLHVVPASVGDIPVLAEMNTEAFKGNGDHATAKRWIEALYAADPIYRYFIAWIKDQAVGYIGCNSTEALVVHCLFLSSNN